mmetsp:Transcript_10638/g.22005  ORF Transcript_10638/g.22005 Transcript_10638/m.22005 type:complete len:304 (-) Transcript_10638:58-969(-)
MLFSPRLITSKMRSGYFGLLASSWVGPSEAESAAKEDALMKSLTEGRAWTPWKLAMKRLKRLCASAMFTFVPHTKVVSGSSRSIWSWSRRSEPLETEGVRRSALSPPPPLLLLLLMFVVLRRGVRVGVRPGVRLRLLSLPCDWPRRRKRMDGVAPVWSGPMSLRSGVRRGVRCPLPLLNCAPGVSGTPERSIDRDTLRDRESEKGRPLCRPTRTLAGVCKYEAGSGPLLFPATGVAGLVPIVGVFSARRCGVLPPAPGVPSVVCCCWTGVRGVFAPEGVRGRLSLPLRFCSDIAACFSFDRSR